MTEANLEQQAHSADLSLIDALIDGFIQPVVT